jgi:hypothetical protein
MASPSPRMPLNAMGHPGLSGPPPNPYRHQGMSPAISQTGQRMYVTNSPGVSVTIYDSIYRLLSFD